MQTCPFWISLVFVWKHEIHLCNGKITLLTHLQLSLALLDHLAKLAMMTFSPPSPFVSLDTNYVHCRMIWPLHASDKVNSGYESSCYNKPIALSEVAVLFAVFVATDGGSDALGNCVQVAYTHPSTGIDHSSLLSVNSAANPGLLLCDARNGHESLTGKILT